MGFGGGAAGWVGCEWVRKRGQSEGEWGWVICLSDCLRLIDMEMQPTDT